MASKSPILYRIFLTAITVVALSAQAAGSKRGTSIEPVVDFTTCAKPEWPKASIRNEETGDVTLGFRLGVDGRIVDSKIARSSGYRDLDKSALAGISKCRFKPGMINGKPVEARFYVTYHWKLE